MKLLKQIAPFLIYFVLFFPSIVVQFLQPIDVFQLFNAPHIMIKKILLDLILIALFLLLILRVLKETPKEAKLHFPQPINILWIFFILIAAIGISSLFSFLSQLFPLSAFLEKKAIIEKPSFQLRNPLLIMLLLLTSAYMEELFFRGYLLDSLKKELPLPRAVAVSSLLFSLGHANQGFWGIPATFCLGILFCIVKEKIQNLHIVAISHWIYNGIVVFLKSFFSFLS